MYRFTTALKAEGISIPMAAIHFYRKGQPIPPEVMACHPEGISLTSCQALKQSFLGDGVTLSLRNIGCIAAAITLGFVDQYDQTPLTGPRVYTDIMKNQALNNTAFSPPTPHDFTEGIVYACRDANRPEFGLFGKDDSGRFKDVETAKAAVKDMAAIQPPAMEAVFFYPPDMDIPGVTPDILVFHMRPVELTRLVQAYQYQTGKRVMANIGGLRVVCSDLIVRPYLTGEINVSSYCLGARLIAQFDANNLAVSIPFGLIEELVEGMENSRTGYPFHLYPGAI